MITALQNFFMKHNKWLFGSLLVVIIVTFVLTIGPQSFFGSGPSQRQLDLNYFGYNLSSPSDQQTIAVAAEVSASLHPELGIQRQQLSDYAYMRVAALGIARQIGIPEPTNAQLEDYVRSVGIFQDPATGTFSAESYNRIVESLKSGIGLEPKVLARVLKEDFIVEKVRDALGGPAYVLPFESQQNFLAANTEFSVALATLAMNDFNPDITPSEDELRAFYEQNPARYEIPERIQVTALQFVNANYVDEVADPDDATLTAWFEQNGDRYAEAAEDPEAEPVVPELGEIRDIVIADWKLSQAVKVAARKAEAFSVALWRNAIERDSPEFVSMLESFVVQSTQLAPYARNNPPSTAVANRELLNSMWIYTDGTRYFSDIGTNATGATVLLFDQRLDARIPPFEEVQSQVSADFITENRQRLFSEKGAELYQQLQDAIANATPFSEAAESLGLSVTTLDPFKGSTPPMELRRRGQLWSQYQNLPAESVSPMVTSGNEGTFLFIASKLVPELDTDSQAFRDFVESDTQFRSQMIGWSRLSELTDQTLASLLPEDELPQ